MQIIVGESGQHRNIVIDGSGARNGNISFRPAPAPANRHEPLIPELRRRKSSFGPVSWNQVQLKLTVSKPAHHFEQPCVCLALHQMVMEILVEKGHPLLGGWRGVAHLRRVDLRGASAQTRARAPVSAPCIMLDS
ncbi:hypothetical protein [Paraburkholderia sacchari]|uniref:hypothetical protein n=1 Tax=Paraburkholderia sacchari TaxID=159450 RepID=UPI0039A4F69B